MESELERGGLSVSRISFMYFAACIWIFFSFLWDPDLYSAHIFCSWVSDQCWVCIEAGDEEGEESKTSGHKDKMNLS